MNNRSALRPRLLAALGAALLLTSCSSAGEDEHRTTDGRASHWGKDMGAPEARHMRPHPGRPITFLSTALSGSLASGRQVDQRI